MFQFSIKASSRTYTQFAITITQRREKRKITVNKIYYSSLCAIDFKQMLKEMNKNKNQKDYMNGESRNTKLYGSS